MQEEAEQNRSKLVALQQQLQLKQAELEANAKALAELRETGENQQQKEKGNAREKGKEKEKEETSNGDVDQSEMKLLRQELFFSMAVGIKLNMALRGRRTNKDIASLYEKVLNSNIPWSEW